MSEDEPKKPTRRRRRRVGDDARTTGVAEPQEPKQRVRRRRLPPGVKATPAWMVAGSRPYAPDPEPEEEG